MKKYLWMIKLAVQTPDGKKKELPWFRSNAHYATCAISEFEEAKAGKQFKAAGYYVESCEFMGELSN